VGDVRLLTSEGPCWWVSGSNGENVINAHGETHAEAWVGDCGQAEAQALCAAETIAPHAQELLRGGHFQPALEAHRLELQGLASLAGHDLALGDDAERALLALAEQPRLLFPLPGLPSVALPHPAALV